MRMGWDLDVGTAIEPTRAGDHGMNTNTSTQSPPCRLPCAISLSPSIFTPKATPQDEVLRALLRPGPVARRHGRLENRQEPGDRILVGRGLLHAGQHYHRRRRL